MPIGGILSAVVSLPSALLGGGGGLLGGGEAAPAGAEGPTGETGLTIPGAGSLTSDPLALAGQLIGLPFGVLDAALELVGGDILGTGQGPGGTAGIAGAARGRPPDLTGFSRGNGRTANRTIVETLDLVSNQIVRRRILPGTPHMMNSDIRAAKKVFRQSAKLHARMPRRTVKESETKKLTNAAVQRAIQSVSCPPKPCD